MEKKDYYTVKEIIIGLRRKYQNIETELRKLTNFCIYDKRLIEGYRFDISKESGKKANIICRYKKKTNLLTKILTSKISIKSDDINTIICTKDNNDRYFISKSDNLKTFPKYSITIKEDKNKEFSEQVSKILDNNFIFNINDSIKFTNDDKEYTLRTTFDNINFITDLDNKLNIIHFNYYSGSDILTVRFFSEKEITNDIIEEVLNTKVPKENLRNYYINLINEESISNKKIILEKIDNSKNEVIFNINEDENQIVLSKLRK